VWRKQRDEQKFTHMLRFADALPALRSATLRDLGGRRLGRDRVTAAAVRLIDLGLFRIGGEKYAELDHHYGATTLQRRDVTVADPARTARSRRSAITAGVRGVADWLGDTPAVARGSYIDPRVISRYESDGQLATIPRLPAVLPAATEAEIAIVALLAGDLVA